MSIYFNFIKILDVRLFVSGLRAEVYWSVLNARFRMA